MRAVKTAVLFAALVGAVGCNSGQPRTYRIAIDNSPLGALPNSCYRNNTPSTLRTIGTNLRAETQWVVWDGVEGKQYLDIGNYSVTMGDAERVDVGDMIEGKDQIFSGELIEQKLPDNSQYTYTKTLSLTITFEDMSATAKGTIEASSQYTCSGCVNNDNKVNCAVKLNFVGRRVDTQYVQPYSP